MIRKNLSAALAVVLAGTLAVWAGDITPSHAQTSNKAAKNKKSAAPPSASAAVPSARERALFLTPGGAYTRADIKANGNLTVSQKYPDFMASHDATPKPGQRVCPISNTVANAKLTWIVGGKTYQFCCPPCISEFVAKAKKDPKRIKAPEAYVKK